MSPSRKYLIDSSVFIEAKRRYYAFDLCPGFWNSVVLFHKKGLMGSIDHVKNKELKDGNDDLYSWAQNVLPKEFFSLSGEDNVVSAYSQVIGWVQNHQNYSPAAKSKFANSTDGWLIAYAKAKDLILSTQEKPAPESKHIVKIPDVCAGVGVMYQDTFEMLRELGISFVLLPDIA